MHRPALLPLPLAAWQETRDTLHAYSRILGKVRQSLTPPQAHWWHISLRPGHGGLTTGPMPGACRLTLDLGQHALVAAHGEDHQALPLAGHSVHSLTHAILHALAAWNVHPAIDLGLFADGTPRPYDAGQAQRYGQVLQTLAALWGRFQAELPGQTSPVQLWPHHFDLSLVWFSGRNAPGVDPADVENAQEQMAFGFSTGDEGIPDAYIYATAYPFPDGLTAAPLPAPARWHTQGWQGALVHYNELVAHSDAADRLLDILRAAQHAGAQKMLASPAST